MNYGLDHGTVIGDNFRKIDFEKLRNDRLERAKAQLNKDGLGAILLFDSDNIRYVTSFNVLHYTRRDPRYYALLPRNGDPYLWCIGGSSEVYREELPWLKGNVRLGMGAVDWLIRESATYGGFAKEIVDILAAHNLLNEPLGIDGIPTGEVLALPAIFEKLGVKSLVNGRRTMLEARKIKTKEEIQLMRISAAIAEAAFADVRDAIRPGVTENELAGIIIKKLLSMGAEWIEGLVVAFGPNSNPNRRTFSDRQIRPGDMGFIDIIGSQFCGYRTCYYRTFTCGRASEEQKELYRRCYEMQYAGMSAIKAGNTSLDIINKWPQPEYWGYDDINIIYENAVCHGLGIGQYDLPIITPALAKKTPVILEENMVLAVEVWEGKRGGTQGARIEEVLVVTRDGYELLTYWPVKEITECWL
jgi:Xaa-Pro aminopeptidase